MDKMKKIRSLKEVTEYNRKLGQKELIRLHHKKVNEERLLAKAKAK